MAVEFRRVHALNLGHACLIAAAMLNAHGVFEDVNTLRQVVDEEVTGRVTSRLVVVQPVLKLVFREDVDRLGTADLSNARTPCRGRFAT